MRKKAKKLKQERMAKEKKRRELNKNNDNAAVEEEEGLFEMGVIKSQENLLRDVIAGKHGSIIDAEWEILKQKEAEAEAELARQREKEQDENAIEKELEEMYEQYKQRKKILTKSQSRIKVGLGDDEDEDEGQVAPTKSTPIPRDIPATPDDRWFDRDVFKGMFNESTKSSSKPHANSDSSSDDEDEYEEEAQEEEEEEEQEEAPQIINGAQRLTQKLKNAKKEDDGMKASGVGAVLESDGEEDEEQARKRANGDFEVVPMSDYSSDEDAQAERMALGTVMLRKRKRNEVIESAYNRYAFNDAELLPDWFRDDESMHNVASIPITKEMVEAFRATQKAINVRTSKKVQEAVGRKRKRAAQQFEKLKNKATKAAASTETSFKDKMKMFESLAKKKTFKNKRPDKEYVIGKRAGGVQSLKSRSKDKKGGKGKKMVKVVDRRQRKDVRGQEAAARKGSKGKKKGKR